MITYQGKTQTVKGWWRELAGDMPYTTFNERIKRYGFERALRLPYIKTVDSERPNALKVGDKTYIGRPHKCGNTVRYTKNRCCVMC